jgi:hypothetical protein
MRGYQRPLVAVSHQSRSTAGHDRAAMNEHACGGAMLMLQMPFVYYGEEIRWWAEARG